MKRSPFALSLITLFASALSANIYTIAQFDVGDSTSGSPVASGWEEVSPVTPDTSTTATATQYGVTITITADSGSVLDNRDRGTAGTRLDNEAVNPGGIYTPVLQDFIFDNSNSVGDINTVEFTGLAANTEYEITSIHFDKGTGAAFENKWYEGSTSGTLLGTWNNVGGSSVVDATDFVELDVTSDGTGKITLAAEATAGALRFCGFIVKQQVATPPALSYLIDVDSDDDVPYTESSWASQLLERDTSNSGLVTLGGVTFTTSGHVGSRTRGDFAGTSLTRDFAYTSDGSEIKMELGGAGDLPAGTWEVSMWSYDSSVSIAPSEVGYRVNGGGESVEATGLSENPANPVATFQFVSDGVSSYEVFIRDTAPGVGDDGVRLNAVSLSLPLTSVVKENNALDLNDGNSWVGLTAPGPDGLADWDNTVTGSNTTVLGADTTWAGIVIEDPIGDVTIDPGNTLTLIGSDTVIDMSSATVDLNLNADLELTGEGSWNVAGGRTLSAGGAISGSAGIDLVGDGTVILSGSNSYAGDTSVGPGTLQLGAADVIPNGVGSGNVSVSGTLDLNDNSETINGLSGSGVVDNAADSTTVTLTAGDDDQSSTFSGTLQNSGVSSILNLEKTGSGILTLTGDSTYTGNTLVNGGELNIGSGGSDGSIDPSSDISVASGATFGVDRSNTTIQGTHFSSNPISGDGNFAHLGSGTTRLSAANTYTGTTTVADGTLAIANVSALSGTSGIAMSEGTKMEPNIVDAVVDAPITVGGTGTDVTFTGPTIDSGSNQFTLGGSISGDGNVIFDSRGPTNANSTILLNGASTYAGSTRMSCSIGTNSRLYVRLGTDNALPATTVLTIDGGNGTGGGRQTELDLNGNDQTLAGLTSVVRSLRTHRVVNDSATPATLTINNSGNYTFPEELGDGAGGNFGLTKSGSGTFRISGSNAYTGPTAIYDGALEIGNLSALGSTSGITIGDGGTLLPDLDGLAISVPITLDSAVTPATINAPTVGSSGQVNTLTLDDAISGTGDLIFNGSLGNNSYGTIVLNAASNYIGDTRLDCTAGGATIWVESGVANALPVTTVLTLDGGPGAGSGRTLRYDLKGFDQTLAGLTNATGFVARRQQVHNSGALATLTIDNTSDYTFGAIAGSNSYARISGAISLVKTGAGSFTLTESHIYAGTTSVNGGTLGLDDASLDSAITVGGSTSVEFTLGSPSSTSSTLDLGTGTVKIIGAVDDSSDYQLMTASGGISGTLTLDSAIPDYELELRNSDTELWLALAPAGYADWAATNAPTDDDPTLDEDDDGVENGVEYVLGGTISTNDSDKLPTLATSGGDMTFTFIRDQASIDGSTTVEIEVGTTLASWPDVYAVPDVAAANNPGVTVVKDSPSAGLDTVTLTIVQAPDTAKFARLSVAVPSP